MKNCIMIKKIKRESDAANAKGKENGKNEK